MKREIKVKVITDRTAESFSASVEKFINEKDIRVTSVQYSSAMERGFELQYTAFMEYAGEQWII